MSILVEKAKFEPEVALGVSEAIELAMTHEQFVTVPILDAHLHEVRAEIRVLEKLSQRLTYTEIAAELYLSLNTVKTHVRHAYMKLGATSRSAAIKRAAILRIL